MKDAVIVVVKDGLTVFGCDISLNHGAVVVLEASLKQEPAKPQIQAMRFFTDKKKYSKADGGTHLELSKGLDHDQKTMSRLAKVQAWYAALLREFLPDIIGVEGYAFSRANQAHQLGEVGGMVRLTTFNDGRSLRIHDPATLKLFATGKGNATKDEVRDAVHDDWNYFWTTFNLQQEDYEPRVLEDFADAYTLAQMVVVEARLRCGSTTLSQLEPHQIRAFNRVTKVNPVNLLVREWT